MCQAALTNLCEPPPQSLASHHFSSLDDPPSLLFTIHSLSNLPSRPRSCSASLGKPSLAPQPLLGASFCLLVPLTWNCLPHYLSFQCNPLNTNSGHTLKTVDAFVMDKTFHNHCALGLPQWPSIAGKLLFLGWCGGKQISCSKCVCMHICARMRLCAW